MAALNFNMQGYVYQEGVRVLMSAYAAAADALHEEWMRAQEEAQAYLEDVASGEREWIGERDEDGYVIWDQEQVHEMEIESKREAQSALRKAFILSLYHHWERSARTWTGDDRRDHNKLASSVEALGYPISPRLGAVRDLANLLKHDNDKRGAEVMVTWPAVLATGVPKLGRRTDWYEAVRLTDDHVAEAFNIVAASGPDEKLLPRGG